MPDRFAKVSKGLYRGGCPTAYDLIILAKKGIKKIVSLDDRCGNDIDTVCQELGLEHIIWGLGDGNDPKVAALKKIIPTLTNNGPTYIHCFHGKDRTGMAVAMYRVYKGWSVKDALEEAKHFGMGTNLPSAVALSYYEAVKRFAKELETDKSNVLDAVTLTRQTNTFAPQSPAINDSTISSGMINSLGPSGTDIEFSNLSRIAKKAYLRIYIKCKSNELLKPGNFWWNNKEDADKNATNSSGKLFSAFISSLANLENINKKPNKDITNNLLGNNCDVCIFRGEQYFVINPNILVDIQEEDDINDVMGVEVGVRDNSADYTFVNSGSGSGIGGGMPDGAAGIVQLPYSGPGMV